MLLKAANRMLLKAGGADAAAVLDQLPPDGPHGVFLAERLRFGPPETWAGWRRGDGAVSIKLYGDGRPPQWAESMAAFRHPGVAPVLDWGAGWTVSRWIDAPRLPRPAPGLDHIAQAVAALHAAGLAHGDLKPANIILADDGPILIDWGEDCAGTPGWRPEYAHDPFQRDLFALERLKGYFLPGGSQ